MSDKRREPRPAIIKDGVALIPLGVGAKDGYAIVDEGLAWLADDYKWALDANKRYAVTGTFERNGKRLGLTYLHRVVAGLDAPGIVDHISRDSLDNRRCNLRLVDARINQINTGLRGGTSKYRGVFRDSRTKKPTWIAQIKNNGKIMRLGSFNDELAAAKAYNEAAIKHFGEYAVLNDV